MSASPACRVLIVDDHEISRSGLTLLLEANDFEVAGTVGRGIDAIPFLQTETVDIVLLDLGLPDVSGLSILADLVGMFDASIVVLSGHLDGRTCETALKMGARAIVSKSDPSTVIIEALNAAMDGRTFCSPETASLLDEAALQEVKLSPRQMAILYFLAQGETNKEIGFRLRIAPPTVSFHVREIREKLSVDSNKKILAAAQSIGLV